MTDAELRDRIEARLQELERSPITAAVAGGLERSYLRDFLNGKKASIKRSAYTMVAAGLDWTVEQLMGETARDVSAAPDFDSPHLGPQDVDVLGITIGGDEGEFWLNGEVVNKVRRPPGIRYAKNVFALNVGGESMMPRHRPRDLIYVQKAAPAPGDDVVIEMKEKNEGGDHKSFLKEFIRRAGSLVICRQFNPPRDLEFKNNEIANIYRVIPLKELMG